MVQGPNDLEFLKPAAYTPAPQPLPAQQRKPQQAVPLTQGPDTVQLSDNAVQAAAVARTHDTVLAAASAPAVAPLATAKLAAVLPPAAPAAVAKAPVTPAAAPAQAAPVYVSNAHEAVVTSAAAKAVLQTEPEVRPTQVETAVKALSALTGSGAALNAVVANKLLTEI